MQVFSEFYSPAEPMLFSDDLVYEIYQRGRRRTARSRP